MILYCVQLFVMNNVAFMVGCVTTGCVNFGVLTTLGTLVETLHRFLTACRFAKMF